ncbi:MAG TPA: universal stress protein [Acidimicrobiales bacterium]
MRRILVAVDGSTASKRAATFVESFFRGDDVAITAVNVAHNPVPWLAPVPFGAVYTWPYGPADQEVLDQALAEEEAEATAVAAEVAPADAEVEVVFGETVEAILKAADDEDVDLVVVGHSGKGFLGRLLEGSVSERVTRASTRPVLVVP